MKREILVAALLGMAFGSIAPAWAGDLPPLHPNAAEPALKQRSSDRDEERLERHRDWEEEQQERREDEWDDEENREDESRWNRDRWDSDQDEDRDRWDERYDSRWDDDRDENEDWWSDRDDSRDDSRWDRRDQDRWDEDSNEDPRWEDDRRWFWWNEDSDNRRSALPGVARLELVSNTNDWVTVSIEGLHEERQLSFTGSNAPQVVDLAPGTYRISFRPAFGRSAWESGYLNVGQTEQIRIQFDQTRDRVQVQGDSDTWTSDQYSPIRLLTVDE